MFLLIIVFSFSACKFDKQVDIAIPNDGGQLFVECYLQDGQPPRLLLTYTQNYFDSVGLPTAAQALVTLTGPGYADTLKPGFYYDSTNKKIYNYQAAHAIALATGQSWQLTAQDDKGHLLSGSCTVQPPVRIDSLTYKLRTNDTVAYVVTWFTDPAGQTDYYRVLINTDSTSASSTADGSFSDANRDGKSIPVRTGYSLDTGQTALVRLLHIDQGYYNFMRSERQAASGNGNPFVQPAVLLSTVQGGKGVFTAIVQDTMRIKIH